MVSTASVWDWCIVAQMACKRTYLSGNMPVCSYEGTEPGIESIEPGRLSSASIRLHNLPMKVLKHQALPSPHSLARLRSIDTRCLPEPPLASGHGQFAWKVSASARWHCQVSGPAEEAPILAAVASALTIPTHAHANAPAADSRSSAEYAETLRWVFSPL